MYNNKTLRYLWQIINYLFYRKWSSKTLTQISIEKSQGYQKKVKPFIIKSQGYKKK